MSYLKIIASDLKILALAAFIITAMSGQASAQSCSELAKAMGITVDELGDGITYVRVGERWRGLTSPTELGLSGPTTLLGIHVVRDVSEQGRVGAIIVSSARRV